VPGTLERGKRQHCLATLSCQTSGPVLVAAATEMAPKNEHNAHPALTGPSDYATWDEIDTELPGYIPFYERTARAEGQQNLEGRPPPTRCRVLRTFKDPTLTHLVSVRSDATVSDWEELARPIHTSCRPGARMVVPDVVKPFGADGKRFQTRVQPQETFHGDVINGVGTRRFSQAPTRFRARLSSPELAPPCADLSATRHFAGVATGADGDSARQERAVGHNDPCATAAVAVPVARKVDPSVDPQDPGGGRRGRGEASEKQGEVGVLHRRESARAGWCVEPACDRFR
jgi:hypothetical protein